MAKTASSNEVSDLEAMMQDSMDPVITTGPIYNRPRIIIYGTEKIGKTTFASNAPNPVFLQTEEGTNFLPVARLPMCNSWSMVSSQLEWLYQNHGKKHNYETLVIDSLDWLERLIWDKSCKDHNVASIELVQGGWGKGYTYALKYWRNLLDMLEVMWKNLPMSIIMIAHAEAEKVEDPEHGNYRQWRPRLHKLAYAMVSEWADAIFMADRRVRVQQEDAGFNRSTKLVAGVGGGGGERILRTNGSPGCVAGNRMGIQEAFLPLEWSALEERIKPWLDAGKS